MHSYNPKKVIVTANGNTITGYADGTFLTITPRAERWTSISGADGEVSRAKSNDKRYEVTLTLAHTSPSNDILSNFFYLDESLDSGVFSLTITDLNGTSILQTKNAWIRQLPDQEFSKENTERAWVIDTDKATRETVGGIPVYQQ